MRQLLLLSTCGVSVFTNIVPEDTRRWLTSIGNAASLSDQDAERLNNHVEERTERLHKSDAAERRKLSAELNGIGAVLDRWKPGRVQHLLVHTDTIVGRAAAKAVGAVLESEGQNVQYLTAPGLRTDDFPSFREALADLTRQIEDWVPSHKEHGWTTFFNLTGGFKSVNAYIQALGMLHADRCVFLFESAAALMEIPQLPVKLADLDEVRTHNVVFRRLANGYPVADADAAGVPDSLLLADGGEISTSVWGDVVWRRVSKKLLAEALLDPLSPRLVVKDAVRRSFRNLEEDRRVLVNEALDALSAHLDMGREPPKSNLFKPLKGNPAPPSTHELYVWSDGAAGRLFGHYEDGRFIADTLGHHL